MLAHELGHVRHRDTLIMTVAATLSGAIGMLASFGGMFGGGRDGTAGRWSARSCAIAAMILAPLAASLVQMAISRSREYEADTAGRGDLRQSAVARLGAARSCTRARRRSPTRRPRPIRRPRICTSSIRCRPAACAACSRPIRRWRSASRACRRWRGSRSGTGAGGAGGGFRRGGSVPRARAAESPWRAELRLRQGVGLLAQLDAQDTLARA